MIDEQMEEMASLYVMGDLHPEQTARFEAELLGSAELQEHVSALQEDFASLALAAPLIKPPAGIRARLVQQFRAENDTGKVIRVSFIPWAIAAALAVMATILFIRQGEMQKQIVQLESRDLLNQTRVAVLQSQVAAYANSSVVVVWEEKNQKGIVRYERLPVQEDRDYQLWALDPERKEPVGAGLIPVVNSTSARVDFHPEIHVSKDTKFAISVEPKGGSKAPAGPVIFIGG